MCLFGKEYATNEGKKKGRERERSRRWKLIANDKKRRWMDFAVSDRATMKISRIVWHSFSFRREKRFVMETKSRTKERKKSTRKLCAYRWVFRDKGRLISGQRARIFSNVSKMIPGRVLSITCVLVRIANANTHSAVDEERPCAYMQVYTS